MPRAAVQPAGCVQGDTRLYKNPRRPFAHFTVKRGEIVQNDSTPLLAAGEIGGRIELRRRTDVFEDTIPTLGIASRAGRSSM